MLETPRILVRPLSHAALAVIAASALLGMTGCGQTGNLYLPTEPAAANRASLPQSMWPVMPDKKKSDTPAPGATPTPASANVPAKQ
jgi:predicted small lipoprotein YifL